MQQLNFKASEPQIALPVLALLFTALLVMGGIIGYTMFRLNEESEASKNTLIRAVLDAELSRISNGVKAYANWDDAVKNFSKSYNKEWVTENFDKIVPDEQHVDAFIIFDDNNEIKHAYMPNSNIPKTIDEIRNILPELRKMAEEDNTVTLSGNMINDSNEIITVGMRLITAIDETIAGQYQHHILVYIDEWKVDDLETIKKRMTISSLSGVAELPKDHDNSVPLLGPKGNLRGYLYWDAPHPSDSFLQAAMLPLSIGIMAIFGLAIIVLKQQQRAIQTIVQGESIIRLLAAGVAASRSPIVILQSSSKGWPISYANPAFCLLSGYSKEDAEGKPIEFLFSSETAEAHKDLLIQILDSKTSGRIEILNVRANGNAFWNEMVISPINSKDRTEGFVVLMKDVSEERRTRQSMAQRDRVLSLGQLAGSVAHELNNLIQPALIYSELLRNQEKFSDPATQETLKGITDSCQGVTRIIRNVLDFSRQGEIERKELPLGSTVKAALEVIRPMMPATLTIQVSDLSKVDQIALICENQMSQLLSQLILNASWATNKQGTVAVHLRKAQEPSSLATRLNLPDSEYAELVVADNGIGMDPATISRALEPFFTTKPVGQGTGLGLSTVNGIVKSWGGAVEIESEMDKGTNIHIFIPIK